MSTAQARKITRVTALRQRGLVLAVRHYGAVRRRTWPTDFAGGAARSGTFSSAIIAWSCRPDARVASTVLALRARAVHRERVFGPLTGGGEEGSVGIPKGTLILWSAHLAGRNAAAWPDPLRFDPDRFVGSDDDRRALAEMTWVPFGRGARNCIGFALAQMELTLIVARLAQRLDLSPVSTSRPSRRTSRRLPAWSSTARREEHRCGQPAARGRHDGAPANDIPTIRDSWPGAAFSVRVASVEEGGTDREEGERVATEEHRILERGQGSSE